LMSVVKASGLAMELGSEGVSAKHGTAKNTDRNEDSNTMSEPPGKDA